jgi:predicted phosphodiesterase
MRYLVLTDIHANLEALDTCLADARARGYDQTICLGDIVGYGPDPNAVVDIVRALEPLVLIRGNHDKVACGLEPPEGFNAVARSAALWTLEVLTDQNRAWLQTLPEGPQVVDDLIEICHGSPFDEDAYIFDELDAVRALQTSIRPLCLFGHTHVAVAFEQRADEPDQLSSTTRGQDVSLQPHVKYLVNPGAVGQPRDGDPRAAYALVDTDAQQVQLVRLPYPIDSTRAKVAQVGLPEVLGARLAVGR